uniref:FYVE, RhoGEF and PH domain containing 6 n=1 Tax=Esox lucius TaxID=8010 RepID=A0A6Q2XUE6_ESOLU
MSSEWCRSLAVFKHLSLPPSLSPSFSTGMQKPPLAPKPKIIQPQRPRSCPSSTPKQDGPSQAHPGSLITPVKVKPALAPKPCLSTALESKTLSKNNGRLHQTIVQDGKTLLEMPRNVGHLNSRNGISRQQENKKPDWDYIIPICLCSRKDCLCWRHSNATDMVIDKIERDWRMLHSPSKTTESRVKPGPRYRPRENRGGNKCSAVHNNSTSLPDVCVRAVEMATNDQLLNPNIVEAMSVCNTRTRADNIFIVSSATGRGEQDGHSGSTIICKDTDKSNHSPAVFRKPLPLPQQPGTFALVEQETPEQGRGGVERSEERDWAEGRQRMEMTVRKVKEPAERKSLPSPSVSEPAGQAQDMPGGGAGTSESWTGLPSSRTPGPSPAPVTPPRKKAFLSEPEAQAQISTSSSQHLLPLASLPYLPQDVDEEELQWVDDRVYEMELSVDKEEGEAREKGDEGGRSGQVEEEEIYCKIVCHPLSTSLPNKTELNSDWSVNVASSGRSEEDVDAPNRMSSVPNKPPRHSSPAASLLKKELSEEQYGEGGKTSQRGDNGGVVTKATQDGGSPRNSKAMRELPIKGSPPTLTPPKLSRSSLVKNKSKSFSSADLTPSDGQKRNSFRRLLDLSISVNMLPKLLAKGGRPSDCSSADPKVEQCVDSQDTCLQDGLDVSGRRNFCCPQLGREQSVDGDEFCSPGAECALDEEYENVPYYEEIPDYVNLPVGSGPRGGGAGAEGRPAEMSEWDVHLRGDDDDIYEEQEPYHPLEKYTEPRQQPSGSSVDEDIGQTDDGQSDEDVMVHSSDEDDGSSSSSKGEPEQSGQSEADFVAKKSKTVHIAREIMSSENVFVNVLKLLHIDFRDAVEKASFQAGKPVVEERVLNQILYYLPQLYELNQDLLRELEERVEHWNEHGRLADIFVKKGPYLKMYSTYIREFDKNVALLDEQSRKNQAFGAIVREFEATPQCANLALKHYLLKPVQRIPQYQLLLTDYLKNLSPDSADYKDTLAALGIMKEVANHANDSMKQGDNFQKLIQVQCRLNGHHEIVAPGRVFLKEGVLMKLSRKVMQPRMFFLFNDTLLYTTPVQSGQFKLNNMLSLAGMKVSKPSQEAFQNELTIESVERSFILSASSAVERDDWLEAISTSIKDHTRKKISFISSKSLEEENNNKFRVGAPLGSKAPIWIPDLRATMCMICTCEFSLTWRRHHCRACGKVVCQSCSTNKQCLEYLKNQLARVCDQCCVILQQQRSDLTPSPTLSPGVKSSFGFTRKTKRIPAALKEVSANTDNSSMSGYLQRSKGNKKQGKRLWFVIKNKVLYTYAASEDVAALESQPLLGFLLEEEKEGPDSQKQLFKLYHKNTLHYVFKADDSQTAQRWIDAFKEAMVL